MNVLAPIAPARSSRPFALALAAVASRSEPGRRLEIAPAARSAFERRAAALRAALRPASPAEAAQQSLAGIPAFALAAAARDLAAIGPARRPGEPGAPPIDELAGRARDLVAPFRTELARLERVLPAAALPPSPPLPSTALRRELAAMLRGAVAGRR